MQSFFVSRVTAILAAALILVFATLTNAGASKGEQQDELLDIPAPKGVMKLDGKYETEEKGPFIGQCNCQQLTIRQLTFRPDGSFTEAISQGTLEFTGRGPMPERMIKNRQTFHGTYKITIPTPYPTKVTLTYSSGPRKAAVFSVPPEHKGVWPPAVIALPRGRDMEEQEWMLID